MKNLRSILPLLAVLLMATAVQAQQTKVHAIVPFTFVAGDMVYPAGDYQVNSTANEAVMRIDNTDRDATSLLLSNSCASVTPSKNTKLVFRRMGDNYFLYQVWVAGNLSGREFLRSQTEIRLAQNHDKSELVIVAANISK